MFLHGLQLKSCGLKTGTFRVWVLHRNKNAQFHQAVYSFYFSTENSSANFIFEIADLMEPNQYNRVQGIISAYEQWNTETVAIEVGITSRCSIVSLRSTGQF